MPLRSDTRPRVHSRCVTVLCSVGFRPCLVSSANSTISHAAEKIASVPCSCQNSTSNSRSGKLPSTRRVFHFSWESAFSSITLFLRPDAQRLHLAIQIAPLQAQQFGGARDVPVRLFELLENVVALRRLADILQAAESFQRTVGLPPRGLWRDVARVHAHLRIQNHDPLDQVLQL